MSTTQHLPTQPQASWPDKPFIRIIRGRSKDAPVKDVLARQAYSGGLCTEVGGAGRDFSRKCFRGRTDSWEEMAAVPSAALADPRAAFEGLDELSPGTGVDGYRIDAVRAVLAYLPDA